MAFPSPFCDISSLGPSGSAGPGINAVRPFRIRNPFGFEMPQTPSPGGGDGGCGCGPLIGAMLQASCDACPGGGGPTPMIK